MKLRPITNTMEITTPEISKKKEEENDVVPESLEFLTVRRYAPPSWASHLNHIPTHFSSLGHVSEDISKLPFILVSTKLHFNYFFESVYYSHSQMEPSKSAKEYPRLDQGHCFINSMFFLAAA